MLVVQSLVAAKCMLCVRGNSACPGSRDIWSTAACVLASRDFGSAWNNIELAHIPCIALRAATGISHMVLQDWQSIFLGGRGIEDLACDNECQSACQLNGSLPIATSLSKEIRKMQKKVSADVLVG